MSPRSVRHRVPPGRAGDGAPAVGADVALLVRHHVVGPVLAWTAAPAVAWAGCAAIGHPMHAPLAGFVVVGAMIGSVASLRRGARVVAGALARTEAGRNAGTAHDGEAQHRAAEFWERTASSLDGAVGVLRDSHAALTAAHREAASLNTANDRDFRHLAGAWIDHYRRSVDEILDGVTVLLAEVRQGRVPARPAFPALPAQAPGRFDQLDRNLMLLRHHVLDAIVQAAAANTGTAEVELNVFAGIATRLRSRSDRVLVELDRLERSTEDPDSLQSLLRVDHKVVQIRRDVEAVQVLASGQLRQSGDPSDVFGILRQATAEIEDYGRVRIGTVAPVQVSAYARSALIHILAALLENATRFSRVDVHLASALEASGLVITVVDEGLHMPAEDLRVLNDLLADPDPVMVRTRLAEGRIGLLVTAKLARQYRLKITLQPAAGQGTQAVVVVPPKLLLHPAEDGAGLGSGDSASPGRTGPAAVPTAAPELASVPPLPGPDQRPGLPRRDAAGRTEVQHDPAQRDGLHRPGLPRRHRAPAGTAPPERPEPVAGSGPVATAHLVGAFLHGAQRSGDSPAPADGAADAPHPARP
ncbi:ATP-binding protein [Streptomyces sp. NBC_00433]